MLVGFLAWGCFFLLPHLSTGLHACLITSLPQPRRDILISSDTLIGANVILSPRASQ